MPTAERPEIIFSIIIPVLNEERHIPACFDALARMSAPRDSFQVLLIDNGSTDRTIEVARRYAVSFTLAIHSHPGGHISTLRNFGARLSRGRILAFLDADCVVPSDWLERAREAFLRDQLSSPGTAHAAIIGSAYRIPPDSTWVARAWNVNPRNRLTSGPVDWLPSGDMFVRRAAFDDVGGFNEQIQTDEDYELCRRMRARGYTVVSDPALAVVHWGTPQTIASFYRKEHWHGENVFQVFMNSHMKLWQSHAVEFGLLYVVLMIGLLVSIVLAVAAGMFIPLGVVAAVAVAAPAAPAILRCVSAGQSGLILRLMLLYTVYGVARAFCIMDVTSWLPKPGTGLEREQRAKNPA